MEFFQILNPVIGHLHLFLEHGNAFCEIVMFAHLARQLVQLGIGDCLLLVELVVDVARLLAAGEDHADQRQHAGKQRRRRCDQRNEHVVVQWYPSNQLSARPSASYISFAISRGMVTVSASALPVSSSSAPPSAIRARYASLA